jgi:hypothetical protein
VLLKIPSRECRVCILDSYNLLLKKIETGVLEMNYILIINKIVDMVVNPKLSQFRPDLCFILQSGKLLLRDVGKRLSEAGQINAIKEITTHYLRKWPAASNLEVAPSDVVLFLLLDEISALLLDLGPAAVPVFDVLIDSLTVLISHASHSVNLSLSWCMRCLFLSAPAQLQIYISKLVSLLQRDTGPTQAEKVENIDRILGYGNILASLIGVVSFRPLFISYESAAMVFGISTQLMKTISSVKDSSLAAAYSLTAWTLVGSLMTLGNAFVKVHLSQLLLIWKSSFPKQSPTIKSDADLGVHLISRYASLSALYSFLTHNRDLITSDISKRVAVLLNNAFTHLSSLPTIYPAAVSLSGDALQMRFIDREALIKVRLLKCYALIDPSHYEPMHSQLLKFTIDNFLPDPDRPDRWASSQLSSGDKTQNLDIPIENSLFEGLIINVAKFSGAEDRGVGEALKPERIFTWREAEVFIFMSLNIRLSILGHLVMTQRHYISVVQGWWTMKNLPLK